MAARGLVTILIVDDEPLILAFLARVLSELGFRVLQAGNGEEAIALAAAETIHVVVTDIAMPGLNGFAVAERLRQARPEVSLLFISGHYDEPALTDHVRSFRAEFLPKPFTKGQFLKRVRDMLDRREAARPV